jgi:hypothetical protein
MAQTTRLQDLSTGSSRAGLGVALWHGRGGRMTVPADPARARRVFHDDASAAVRAERGGRVLLFPRLP